MGREIQVEIPAVGGMGAQERLEAQDAVAMRTPEFLKRWLEASGRRWVVFDSWDLVDSLPWPAGVETLMALIYSYRDHRRTISTGDTAVVKDAYGNDVEVPGYKDESLELAELDRCIRWLIGKATAKDPKWAITNPPM